MREEELSAVFPFWEKLKKNQRDALVKDTKILSVLKGQRLLVSGSPYGAAFVRKGSFLALLLGETDTETELFRMRKEQFLVLDYEETCGQEIADIAYAAATNSEVCAIGKETFSMLIKSSPVFAEAVVKGLLGVFPILISAIGQRDYFSLDKRIATVLLSESVRQRGLTLLITHSSIAAKIGSAREAVTRKLQEMSADGTLQYSRGKIVILNREKLKKRQNV